MKAVVKILKDVEAYVDGVHLVQLVKGEVHEMGQGVAHSLVKNGDAALADGSTLPDETTETDPAVEDKDAGNADETKTGTGHTEAELVAMKGAERNAIAKALDIKTVARKTADVISDILAAEAKAAAEAPAVASTVEELLALGREKLEELANELHVADFVDLDDETLAEAVHTAKAQA